jgi:GST-like protein
MNRYKNEANRLYGVMDRRLAESKFMACDAYTIADMAVMPWLRFPERQGVEIDAYPNLKRWRDGIAARPAVQRALQVLADRRRTGPQTDKERENLFGSAQFQRRSA